MNHSAPSAPLVSVVIPVWNAERFVQSTLRAVAAQSFSKFEVIVIDDCSTDRSPDIVRAFCEQDPRFRYERTESNFGGPAGPRNLGVALARGQYVAFCDADDLWVSHKLQVNLDVLATSGATVVCSQSHDFTDETALLPVTMPPGPVMVKPISRRKMLLKNWVSLSSAVVLRSALIDQGGFNTAASHVAVEDYDMWVRISRSGGRVIRIAAPLMHYRKLPTSISADKRMMIRRALGVIGDDYRERGLGWFYPVAKPVHLFLYAATSTWMRVIRKKL